MPSLRASDNPIAIACFGFVTFFPLRPLFSLPCFIAFISRSTLLPAAGLYFRVELDFLAAALLAGAFFSRRFLRRLLRCFFSCRLLRCLLCGLLGCLLRCHSYSPSHLRGSENTASCITISCHDHVNPVFVREDAIGLSRRRLIWQKPHKTLIWENPQDYDPNHRTNYQWVLVLIVVVGVTMLGVRSFRVLGGPELQPWHTFVPHELSADQLDVADWNRYLAQEDEIMASVRAEVSQKLAPGERVPINRYFEASPVYPAHFAHDWNRSYVLEPDGKPIGVVVLLHGLTDSPYSLRHVAQRYRDRGFLAIGLRLPGHGTVPAGLTNIRWEDWMAATRLAVREARRRVPAPAPLHLVGFSNGGALAMKYSLDALEDPKLSRPDRILLFTPMIGITRFARFAGLAALPAILPPFAKAAWLSVVPEFNPFKYNSFP